MLRDLQVRTDVSRKLHLPIVLKQGSVDLVRIQARPRAMNANATMDFTAVSQIAFLCRCRTVCRYANNGSLATRSPVTAVDYATATVW